MSRPYTVKEIEDLRHAVECKIIHGRFIPNVTVVGKELDSLPSSPLPLKHYEMILAREAMVKTHMEAGHTIMDLYSSELAVGTTLHTSSGVIEGAG